MKNTAIPTSQKLALTPAEASALSNISAEFFRLAGELTKLGAYDLPCFWIGNRLQINKELLIRWLNEKSTGREDFKTALIKQRLEDFKNNPVHRGRKRRVR